MATDKPRLSISMSEERFAQVLEFKKERGIATQSKAILQLMEMGLRDMEKEILSKKSPSTDEAAPGENVISMEESNRLLEALGLIQKGQDLTDDDLAFLTHIIGLLNAWFGKGK